MTDIEILERMLSSSNVEYSKNEEEELYTYRGITPKYNLVVREKSNSDSNVGYSFFYTVFSFDDNGKLISIGAFE